MIEIAGIAGLFDDLTLRRVRLRDDHGHVHFVPNGPITTVTNKGGGFAYAVRTSALRISRTSTPASA